MPNESDFDPCLLHRHGDGKGFSITFDDFGEALPVFEDKGYEGGGYSWKAAVHSLLRERAPEVLDRIGFDPEADMFCAYGDDVEALRTVATLIREMTEDHALLRHAVDNVRANRPQLRQTPRADSACPGTQVDVDDDRRALKDLRPWSRRRCRSTMAVVTQGLSRSYDETRALFEAMLGACGERARAAGTAGRPAGAADSGPGVAGLVIVFAPPAVRRYRRSA